MTEENLNAEIVIDTPAQEDAKSPVSLDDGAKQAGVIAIGNYYLTAIYNKKVNETHAMVANLVAKIMGEAGRLEAWTHDEVMEIWNRVESELKSTL